MGKIEKLSDIVKEIKINTAEEFFRELSVTGKYKELFNGEWIFRGQSKSEYKLIPSACRENNKNYFFNNDIENLTLNKFSNLKIRAEYILLCKFYDEIDAKGLYVPFNNTLHYFKNDYFKNREKIEQQFKNWISDDFKEIAALAQHYNIPTRLLDWTEDLYVAVYFMISEYLEKEKIEIKNEENEYLSLWAFNVEDILTFNKFYFLQGNENRKKTNKVIDNKNEEIIKIVGKRNLENKCNIELKKFENIYEFNSENRDILKYNEDIDLYNQNINKIKNENLIRKTKLFYEIPIKIVKPPYCSNQNLNAQKGILIYHEIGTNFSENTKEDKEYKLKELYEKEMSLDELIFEYFKINAYVDYNKNQPIFYKFIIPKNQFMYILSYLNKLGYDGARIFPGYYGVSRKIKEDIHSILFKK